ncbi:hypothetical protein CJU75_19035 [Pseudomonas fragi]|nr:hypothetical protein CJU75_19035 [Pseudomonas fragi]
MLAVWSGSFLFSGLKSPLLAANALAVKHKPISLKRRESGLILFGLGGFGEAREGFVERP